MNHDIEKNGWAEECRKLEIKLSKAQERVKELEAALQGREDQPKKRPSWYYGSGTMKYTEGQDPEATCLTCGLTFLCDAMDALCRMCDMPYGLARVGEFYPFGITEKMYRKIEAAKAFKYK